MNMKTWWILTLAVALLALAGCKEEKKAEAPQTAAQTQPVPPATPKPTPQKEAAPAPKPAPKVEARYFLIAGCFEYENNATKLVEDLQKNGFPDARILPYFENLHLVCYSGYATRQEAETALEKIRQEKGRADTWLHQSKRTITMR